MSAWSAILVGLLSALVGGGGLAGVLKIRADNRLTGAETEKVEAEADAETIRNMRRAADAAIRYARDSEERARAELLQVRKEFADYRASMEARVLNMTQRLGELEAQSGAQQLEIQRLQLLGPHANGRVGGAFNQFGE